MMKNSLLKLFPQKALVALLLSFSVFAFVFMSIPEVHADHTQKLIMGRSVEAFPETMSALQEEIKKAGYAISIVQRVDIGLTGMGFKTDKYRVVFFGKPEEIQTLPQKYPLLTPYLPLSIAIFAEEQETVLIAMSPLFLEHSYSKEHPELSAVFQRWDSDIQAIIHRVCYGDEQ